MVLVRPMQRYFCLGLFFFLCVAEPCTADFSTFFGRTFGVSKSDTKIVVLVDVPPGGEVPPEAWADRLLLAQEWETSLTKAYPGKNVQLIEYDATGVHNADLPSWGRIRSSGAVALLDLEISTADIVLALTQYSATAPLKAAAKKAGFRGATLPGFSRPMTASFNLKVSEVAFRCSVLKKLLSQASSAELVFEVDGSIGYALRIDLRYREAHSSDGVLLQRGLVANLPGGEAYKVPYEGEREGEPSLTTGLLPIQHGDEIVLHRIEGNRTVEILSRGSVSDRLRREIFIDPVAGNVAELGAGVLESLGVEPMPNDSHFGDPTLLNEKLGIHIAFGRSEHLGGIISPASFLNPAKAFHQDYIFIDSVQPRVRIKRMDLVFPDSKKKTVVVNNAFVPSLFGRWARVSECARKLLGGTGT